MSNLIKKIAPAVAVAIVAIAAGLLSTGAVAGNGGTKVFGKGDDKLKPDCGPKPDDSCFAIGSVTGFINKLGKDTSPFVAPSNGKIVAWAIELGHKPSRRVPEGAPEGQKSNLEFFQDLFGNERYGKGPVARLAILKRKGKSVRFELKDQSPAVKLGGPFYNKDTVITLDQPLNIRKGEIVGLTSLTWVPTLRERAAGGGKASWRASRERGKCGGEDARSTKPQKKVGTTREYGCKFTDRLFYKAYFVPNN